MDTHDRCVVKIGETQIDTGDHCSTPLEVQFSVRKINLSIQSDLPLEGRRRLADLGHLVQAENGLFSADIVFETSPPTPGFVVQYIKKDLTVTVPGGETETSFSYWEIFYVSPEGWAVNPDGFVQKPCEDSSGEACQVGVSYFYPYPGDVTFDGTTMKDSPVLREIFGSHVKFGSDPGRVKYAGGLPSSASHRPTMTGLCVLPCYLTHAVQFSWSSREKPARTKVLERIWRTCGTKCQEINLERPTHFANWSDDELRKLWKSLSISRAGGSPPSRTEMAKKLTHYCTRIAQRRNFTASQ